MSIVTRVYVVTNKATGEKTLVEESHPSKALRIVTSGAYEVEAASSTAIIDLLQKGASVIRPQQAEAAVDSAA